MVKFDANLADWRRDDSLGQFARPCSCLAMSPAPQAPTTFGCRCAVAKCDAWMQRAGFGARREDQRSSSVAPSLKGHVAHQRVDARPITAGNPHVRNQTESGNRSDVLAIPASVIATILLILIALDSR